LPYEILDCLPYFFKQGLQIISSTYLINSLKGYCRCRFIITETFSALLPAKANLQVGDKWYKNVVIDILRSRAVLFNRLLIEKHPKPIKYNK
jgi:hypothetical protein